MDNQVNQTQTPVPTPITPSVNQPPVNTPPSPPAAQNTIPPKKNNCWKIVGIVISILAIILIGLSYLGGNMSKDSFEDQLKSVNLKQGDEMEAYAESVITKIKDGDNAWLRSNLSNIYLKHYANEDPDEHIAQLVKVGTILELSSSGPSSDIDSKNNVITYSRKATITNKPVIVTSICGYESGKYKIIDILIQDDKDPEGWHLGGVSSPSGPKYKNIN